MVEWSEVGKGDLLKEGGPAINDMFILIGSIVHGDAVCGLVDGVGVSTIPDRFKEFTGVGVGVKNISLFCFLSRRRCTLKAFFAGLCTVLEGLSDSWVSQL